MYHLTSPNPNVVCLHIRVSDNVLEEEDWPIRKLTLDLVTKKVTFHEDLAPGAYSLDTAPRTGWTLEKVQRWTAVDPTGWHPETYNEIQDASEKFTQFFDFQDFLNMLEGAERLCAVEDSIREGLHGNYESYYMDEEY